MGFTLMLPPLAGYRINKKDGRNVAPFYYPKIIES